MTLFVIFFFFNDTATTEIYTLSLHDALPISADGGGLAGGQPVEPAGPPACRRAARGLAGPDAAVAHRRGRSEEHTSELQSPCNLVCRLLLEKKKNKLDQRVIIKYIESPDE